MKNQTLEIIFNRSSCRNFSERKVSQNDLDEMIAAGLSAPSSGNFQAYSIIHVTDAEKKARLAQLSYNQKFIEKVPVVLLFCIDFRRMKQLASKYPFPLRNADSFTELWFILMEIGMVMQNMCIAAESKGMKSICVGNPISYMEELSKLCQLPSYVCPALILCIGYPAQEKKPMNKYAGSLLVHENVYRDVLNQDLEASFQEHFKNWKKPLSEESLQAFSESCKAWSGESFENYAVNQIRKQGYFNYYQYFISIFYRETPDMMTNTDYHKYFKNQGFNWLETDSPNRKI